MDRRPVRVHDSPPEVSGNNHADGNLADAHELLELRWRVGARIDALELALDDPRRYTMMFDWSNSEFSRLRFQVARNDDALGNSNVWTLQYLHSIGAHGAHTF